MKDQESSNDIKLIREATGMSRRAFCEHFKIPMRTMADWEYGVRNPPKYVQMFLWKLIKYEHLELPKDEEEK